MMNNSNINETEVIASTRQREWGWPAVANFTLGSAGACFYLLQLIVMATDRSASMAGQPLPLGMLAPALMGLGFVFLAAEAGRPSRSVYLLYHLKRSWISRESLAFIAFIPAVILDQLFPHLFFKAWAAIGAIIFVVCQGFIVYSARAVPSWHLPIVPLVFLSSGLVSGSGVSLILVGSRTLVLGSSLVSATVAFIILNLAVWLGYLRWSSTLDFISATQSLRRPLMIISVALIGHILPIVILVVLQFPFLVDPQTPLFSVLAMASGLAILIAVTVQKAGIIFTSGIVAKIVL